MVSNVALKTIWEGRRAFVWWSLGVVALVLVNIAFYPSIKGNEQYDQLLEDYPEVVQAFFGTDLTSPAGYLYSQLFSLLVPLVLMIYVVGGGARAIAGEEEAGTLDLLLSLPISRTRLVVEKAVAIAVQLALLSVVLFASIALPGPLFELDIGLGNLAAAVVGSYLLALLYGFLALLVGSATGSRSVAIGVAAALAVAAYMLNALGQTVDLLEPWRILSPFEHVGDPLREGLGGGALVLAALALLAAAAAPWLFSRRDVAV